MVDKVDFIPIDLENCSIVGEMHGTWLLVESKGTSRGKLSHYEIDI